MHIYCAHAVFLSRFTEDGRANEQCMSLLPNISAPRVLLPEAKVGRPQHDRRADDRLYGISFRPEGWLKIAECTEDQDDIGRVAEPGAQPVSPGAVEADEIAVA